MSETSSGRDRPGGKESELKQFRILQIMQQKNLRSNKSTKMLWTSVIVSYYDQGFMDHNMDQNPLVPKPRVALMCFWS